jgi:topoisomerase-4 subunit B
MAENQYTEDNIRSLDWKEHIRLRPGMYIGKLGDGAWNLYFSEGGR